MLYRSSAKKSDTVAADDAYDKDQVVNDDAALESEQMWDGINCILGSAPLTPPPTVPRREHNFVNFKVFFKSFF